MPQVMKKASLKVQRHGTVPASFVESIPGSGKPLRQWTRKVKGESGKLADVLYLRVGPGTILDPEQIPKDRLEKMQSGTAPMCIPIEDPIPPSPPKTAVGVAATDAAEDNIARVDTRKKAPARRKGRK